MLSKGRNKCFGIKSSWSKLDSKERSTVLILHLQKGFPGSSVDLFNKNHQSAFFHCLNISCCIVEPLQLTVKVREKMKNIILRPSFMNYCNKLQCLYLANFFQLSLIFAVRLEPTRLKNFSGVPVQDKLLALSTNNRLGLKGLPGNNNPGCYGFITLGPWC